MSQSSDSNHPETQPNVKEQLKELHLHRLNGVAVGLTFSMWAGDAETSAFGGRAIARCAIQYFEVDEPQWREESIPARMKRLTSSAAVSQCGAGDAVPRGQVVPFPEGLGHAARQFTVDGSQSTVEANPTPKQGADPSAVKLPQDDKRDDKASGKFSQFSTDMRNIPLLPQGGVVVAVPVEDLALFQAMMLAVRREFELDPNTVGTMECEMSWLYLKVVEARVLLAKLQAAKGGPVPVAGNDTIN